MNRRKVKRRIAISSSGYFGAALAQQFLEERAVATRLVLAVAAHRHIRGVRQARQQLEDSLRRGLRHLGAITLAEEGPALIVERLGRREAHQARARRELGKPEIEIVALRIVSLLHA